MALHQLFVGRSTCGKTTLAKDLCTAYYKRGFKSLVFDPQRDKWPNAALVTNDIYHLIDVAKRSSNCALFIDDAGSYIGLHPKPEIMWLATESRHRGHWCHFMCQGPKQLNLSMRECCQRLYAFGTSSSAINSLRDEWPEWALDGLEKLPRGYYKVIDRFIDPSDELPLRKVHWAKPF